MKEIIYIQAGEFSNYTGTHFWNTQESYLPYDEHGDTEIEGDVSFCEGVDEEGRSTMYPRLLIFDRKSNFGTTGADDSEDDSSEIPALWTDGVVEYRQDKIPKSEYQKRMDEEAGAPDDTSGPTHDVKPEESAHDVGNIRYWSDFSRVYYLSRSFQKLPDLPEWEQSTVDWTQGQELFKRFNEESELMEGAFRISVEGCDNLQGIQIINDTDSFGSFMASFLASFRDEYLKLPSICIPVISGAISEHSSGYDAKTTKKLINEAFYLRTLNELSSMNIPIQEPTSWPKEWSDSLGYTSDSIFHQSAVLSAHVETCTLPFRLRLGHQAMSSVSGMLNWRNTCPFGELSGVFPFDYLSSLEERMINFSSNSPIKPSSLYSQLSVTRGFSEKQVSAYTKWSLERQPSNMSSIASIHASAYPLPNSFPSIKQAFVDSPTPTSDLITHAPSSLPMTKLYSSLSTSSNTAKTLEGYARFVEKAAQLHTSAIATMDISFDDLRELANDLWTMHDGAAEVTDET
ncbi:tubulin nucleotide-binding domain-like protein [Pholiota conissans]|uniref:Tubulin nucleotide-binding domain-like protein n=1 Tax=Pholiota conissans TaxID=109636 RepID=A0A9P5Z4P3_9AGAR|nr:tubulin nucleotide-binding domain-like protein [Pholiota conissans]